MLLSCLVFTAGTMAIAITPEGAGRIDGVVVHGAAGNLPAGGVEVVLRAGEQGMLVPVAQVVTDDNGRFVFDGLPLEPGLIYSPGANRQGVHYPGPRIALQPGRELARLQLTVYDAIASPSPLVIEEQQIEVAVETGSLLLTETLVVSNPAKITYVGEAVGDMPPVTLRLAIPPGFERVTFYDEFHGRRFQVVAGYVATDIPWTPGSRTLKYTYRLPVEERNKVFQRILDLPCSKLRVVVSGEAAGELACNLPRVASNAEATIFESAGERLPTGFALELQFGRLPQPWITYARWGVLGLLGALMLATALFWRRRPVAAQTLSEGGTEPCPKVVAADDGLKNNKRRPWRRSGKAAA